MQCKKLEFLIGCKSKENANGCGADTSVGEKTEDGPEKSWNGIQTKGCAQEAIHTKDGVDFSIAKVRAKRQYLLVLLRWEELALDGMRSDQTALYYECSCIIYTQNL